MVLVESVAVVDVVVLDDEAVVEVEEADAVPPKFIPMPTFGNPMVL